MACLLLSSARAALGTVVAVAVFTVATPIWGGPLGRASDGEVDLWTPPRLRDDDAPSQPQDSVAPIQAARWQSFVAVGLRWIEVGGSAGLEGTLSVQLPLDRFLLGRAMRDFGAVRNPSDGGWRAISPPRLSEEGPVHRPGGSFPTEDSVVPWPQADAFGVADQTRSDSLFDRVTEGAPVLTPELARACVRAALRAAALGNDERLDAIAGRARASAALPELRLRMARTTDESGRLTYLDEDTARYATSGSATYWLEGRLTFRLDRLLFADEELSVERIRLDRAEARSRLAAKVIKALSDWQRAVVRRTTDGATPEERMAAILAELEAIATLDVLTDGWFTAEGASRAWLDKEKPSDASSKKNGH